MGLKCKMVGNLQTSFMDGPYLVYKFPSSAASWPDEQCVSNKLQSNTCHWLYLTDDAWVRHNGPMINCGCTE